MNLILVKFLCRLKFHPQKFNTSTKMKVSLICSGSELLAGKLNSNASYIGSKLFENGINLHSIVTVGDRKNDLLLAFKRTFDDSDVIISTGGLGPTFDDITVETVAEILNLQVYEDENVLSSIAAYFKKRKIEMPENNKKQAGIIKGAKVLNNYFGTAPGQAVSFDWFENDKKKIRKTLFLLPGPPKEMNPMFGENIIPFLRSYSVKIIKNINIRVFGLTESKTEQMIRPVVDETLFGNCEFVEFGIIASDSIIDVKFAVSGENEILIDDKISKIKTNLTDILKENIFVFGNETLAEVVGKLLIENKKTISIAESCTSGLLSATITSVAGSSLYFKNAIVSYSNAAKNKFLGVEDDIIEKYGAVSKETAEKMAKGILELSGTDLAVSVTGIAGPGGGSKEKPVGLVFIGFATKKNREVFQYNFSGSRSDIREKTVNTAMDLLRRKLTRK
jgi:nicotinamide-nucleotide amidase